MAVEIIPFEPEHAGAFRDLNLAWLRKYFRVEQKDKQLLDDCEQHIIQPGGMIFMATEGHVPIGCFAFIKSGESIVELGKMTVDPSCQGRRIGQQLLDFAIRIAREQDWKKIVLYSSTRLGPALHIYRKFGFREVPLEKESPYVRSDIKMELEL
jgi:ribosomal protein S18 acetylase RimI-like enzyme